MQIRNQTATIPDTTPREAQAPKWRPDTGSFQKVLEHKLGDTADRKAPGKTKAQRREAKASGDSQPGASELAFAAQRQAALTPEASAKAENTQAASTQESTSGAGSTARAAEGMPVTPVITGSQESEPLPEQALGTGTEQPLQQEQEPGNTRASQQAGTRGHGLRETRDADARAQDSGAARVAERDARTRPSDGHHARTGARREPADRVEKPIGEQEQDSSSTRTGRDRFTGMLERARDELTQYGHGAARRMATGESRGAVAAQQTEPAETSSTTPPKQPLSELNRVSAVQPRKEAPQAERPQRTEQRQAERQPAEPAAAAAPREPETAAPVQPKETAPVRQQTPAEQVEARITENLQNKRMEFEMRLYPKELGRVDVRMTLEDGKLVIQILAQSAKAEEALRTQAQGLVASLRSSSQELTSVQVVTGTQAANSHMYGGLDANQPGTDGNNAQQSRQDGESGRGGQSGDAESEYQQQGYRQENTEPKRLLNYTI